MTAIPDLKLLERGHANLHCAIRERVLSVLEFPSIQAAFDAGCGYFPPGDYVAVNLQVPSNLHIYGEGRLIGNGSAPLLVITGDNVIIEDITCTNGYAGAWAKPAAGQTVNNLTVRGCRFEHLNHPIFLGAVVSDDPAGDIFDVLIDGNVITDGLAESDGIKTVQRCRRVIITNNRISGMQRDGIDLFASGDDVVISGNILTGNTQSGIDIKQHIAAYPPAFGYNRQVLITNNIISDNLERGVSINMVEEDTQTPYMIVVAANSFSGNDKSGLHAMGKYINIANNLFYRNCLSATNPGVATLAAIYLQGQIGKIASYINVIGNQIINNGNAETIQTGIRVYDRVENCNIKDNVIVNDPGLDNSNQKIGLHIGASCQNIIVRDNHIIGHDLDIEIRDGAGVVE
jgi:parallel beta-helix repeat protein